MKLLYLVHDLADPAVARRVAMLQAGGASLTLMGFHRTAGGPGLPAGVPAIDLGQTHDGRFAHRIAAILREAWRMPRHRALFATADVVMARNLEMLALAVRGRSLSRIKPRLIYESLDIHHLLLGPGLAGQTLRRLEGWLAKRASLLLTSSPAFISNYFTKLSRVRLPVELVENKVFGVETDTAVARSAGPPWRIGWFGAIRCRQSLDMLRTLVRDSQGRVEVIIRGRPAYDQFADFDASTTDTPGLSFRGPYANPGDLAAIYGEVHFTWAIDRFEAGQNSAWLLPNRLYEGGLYGAVPLAEAAVETGRFLARLGIGVPLADPLPAALADFFATLTPAHYNELATRSAAVPRTTWACDRQDCRQLVRLIAGQPAGVAL